MSQFITTSLYHKTAQMAMMSYGFFSPYDSCGQTLQNKAQKCIRIHKWEKKLISNKQYTYIISNLEPVLISHETGLIVKPHEVSEPLHCYFLNSCLILKYRKIIATGRRLRSLNNVSNHRRLDCLLNRLFSRTSMITSQLRVTGLCERNSPVAGDSYHKGPVTRKTFTFDDVIIREHNVILFSISLIKLGRLTPCTFMKFIIQW